MKIRKGDKFRIDSLPRCFYEGQVGDIIEVVKMRDLPTEPFREKGTETDLIKFSVRGCLQGTMLHWPGCDFSKVHRNTKVTKG